MIYHNKMVYKSQNNIDKNLIIVAFDPDSGLTDAFLGMDSIYTSKYDGTLRYSYGAKYNTVAKPKLTMVKRNGSDLSLSEFRNIAKWLTGARQSSWLDLYTENNEAYTLDYSFLCKVVNLEHYKMDGRTIGVVVTFECDFPWALSPIQTVSRLINGSATILVNNQSDDLYSYICPDIVFHNSNVAGSLSILNADILETAIINNIAANELISMSSNQIIYSDNTSRIFGDDFNFVWPRLRPGNNNITITGDGEITITYRYPMKVGDCSINVN